MTDRLLKLIHDCEGFEWDEANKEKNWEKHKVAINEIEEVFANAPLLTAEDTKHSLQEVRYWLLGQTDTSRKLFISFTIRNHTIRVISARDQSHKERSVYEQTT